MKRLILFAMLAMAPLGIATAFGEGGGAPPKPRNLDCKKDSTGNCTIASPDCITSGGYCVMGGSGQRWHDGESWVADGCGCMLSSPKVLSTGWGSFARSPCRLAH